MKVTVILESRFGATNEQRGLEVTRMIWTDMQQNVDCLDHEIVQARDEPGHIIVISHWTTAEAANAIRNRYAAHPNAIVMDSLVTEPSRRFVGLSETSSDA